MSRIPNWKQTERRNASDVGMAGTVREWEHVDTGERLSVRKVEPDNAPRRYDIRYHDEGDHVGEAVTARDTLNAAVSSATDTLRNCPDGLDADGDD